MLPVHHFEDAVLAERVPALRNVRIIECLEAYDALGELSDNVVNVDFDRLFVPGIVLLQAWLLHDCVYHLSLSVDLVTT